MSRITPEQRELCRLLSPLHEKFCAKHQGWEPHSDTEGNASSDCSPYNFSLSEFRSTLDELWSAAKALDRSERLRRGGDPVPASVPQEPSRALEYSKARSQRL